MLKLRRDHIVPSDLASEEEAPEASGTIKASHVSWWRCWTFLEAPIHHRLLHKGVTRRRDHHVLGPSGYSSSELHLTNKSTGNLCPKQAAFNENVGMTLYDP